MIFDKKKILVLAFFFLPCKDLSAQDSLRKAKFDSLRPRLTWALNWDARSSFIDKKAVNIWGINEGITIGRKRHQMTLGYYWLTTNGVARLLDLRKNSAKKLNLDFYTKTDLYFFSLMYWHNFIEKKRWRFSLPIEIGIGSTRTEGNRLVDDYKIWRRKDVFVPVQSGLFLRYKINRWITASTQAGYRFGIANREINKIYDGWYYSYGFGLTSEAFTDSYKWVRTKIREKKHERNHN